MKLEEIVIASLEASLSHFDINRRLGSHRVYFALARSAALVKIGTSWRLPHRLIEIEAMSPVPIELIGDVDGGADRERHYHEMFARHRSHGEWFHYAPEVEERIAIDCLADRWNEAPRSVRETFIKLAEISK